ncbi:hypothetical protein [Pedobacter sp. Leaf194]|uniref:hypothetical protein n=1 Tax=Pedobacter sp. Leaf194 TaxID=1736297 RepID=UPI000703624D|nr:hypothetical protein [Pedobacter sp. Leaf194]KQS36159.1 hypothetical protein ASG14_12055 [Pedobacter sp. Leaf194]
MEHGVITILNRVSGNGFIKYGNMVIKFELRETVGKLYTYNAVSFEIKHDYLETKAVKVRKIA